MSCLKTTLRKLFTDRKVKYRSIDDDDEKYDYTRSTYPSTSLFTEQPFIVLNFERELPSCMRRPEPIVQEVESFEEYEMDMSFITSWVFCQQEHLANGTFEQKVISHVVDHEHEVMKRCAWKRHWHNKHVEDLAVWRRNRLTNHKRLLDLSEFTYPR
jgi:hypothetical protein